MVHVSCPLCAKWSSVRRFPAGAGSDIPLAEFRGLGRGRGFRLGSRTSGLADRDLCLAVKEKTLQIVGALVAHGYLSHRDVLRVLDSAGLKEGLKGAQAEADSWKQKATQLEAERQYYEMEIERLEEQERAAVRRRREMEAGIKELEQRLSSVESDRDSLVAKVRKLLRKLRGVADDLEYAAMMDEDLSDTREKLTKAMDGFESAADLSSDEEGPEAADGVMDDDEL